MNTPITDTRPIGGIIESDPHLVAATSPYGWNPAICNASNGQFNLAMYTAWVTPMYQKAQKAGFRGVVSWTFPGGCGMYGASGPTTSGTAYVGNPRAWNDPSITQAIVDEVFNLPAKYDLQPGACFRHTDVVKSVGGFYRHVSPWNTVGSLMDKFADFTARYVPSGKRGIGYIDSNLDDKFCLPNPYSPMPWQTQRGVIPVDLMGPAIGSAPSMDFIMEQWHAGYTFPNAGGLPGGWPAAPYVSFLTAADAVTGNAACTVLKSGNYGTSQYVLNMTSIEQGAPAVQVCEAMAAELIAAGSIGFYWLNG